MDRGTADADRFPALAGGAGVGVGRAAAGAAPAVRPRAGALDALRGLAILGMVLVAAEPLGTLPTWMYHAQTPPPDHAMNTAIPGMTWPDLVFPLFLFAMGAAIPLALARRLDRGAGYPAILAGAAARGALLVFFALFRQHFDSAVSGIAPAARAWIVGLAGFGVLCLIFTRFPDRWAASRRSAARLAGWAAAAAMFAAVSFPDGSGFRPERIDIILLILAYCAVFGTAVWLLTRHSLLARLGVLAVVVSLRVVGYNPGWVNVLYAFDPVPWLYKFSFFQFLCAVIPGTIVGDLMLAWMRSRESLPAAAEPRGWRTTRAVMLGGVSLLAVPLVLTGIQGRHVFATTVLAAGLCAVAHWLARRPFGETETLAATLVHWGSFWLLLGLLLDPFDGGTKKVPETFAWFFQGCGLAIFVLVAFLVVAEVLRRERWLQLLIDAGQNPMLAYVGLGMVVLPLLGLTGVAAAVDALALPPWVAFGWSVVLTLVVALLARVFTRVGIFWRA